MINPTTQELDAIQRAAAAVVRYYNETGAADVQIYPRLMVRGKFVAAAYDNDTQQVKIAYNDARWAFPDATCELWVILAAIAAHETVHWIQDKQGRLGDPDDVIPSFDDHDEDVTLAHVLKPREIEADRVMRIVMQQVFGAVFSAPPRYESE